MNRYWASYGLCGFLGNFAAAVECNRGAKVVVESPRGLEVATVLEAVDERFNVESSGRVVRAAVEGDRLCAERLLQQAAADAATLPVLIADAELLLDGTLILHVMPFDDVDLTEWVTQFSATLALKVRLLNLADLPREKREAKGCGEANCGEGGCGTGGGCSTGSCSKGKVKTSAEMTAYFASLRKSLDGKRTSLA